MKFIRFVLILLGYFFIFAALFLYEDEERRLQNRVEEWWVRLRDTRQFALTASAAFLQATARLTSRGFDWIFGRKLISFRVVGVSFCFSVASIILIGLFQSENNKFHVASPFPVARLLQFAFVFVLALIPAIAEALPQWFVELGFLAPDKWIPFIWGILLCVNLSQFMWVLMNALYQARGAVVAAYVPLVIGIVFGVSLASDLSCIALTRWSLQLVSEADQLFKILLIMVVNIVLVFFVVIAPVRIGVEIAKHSLVLGAPVMLSVSLNAFNLLMCVSALFVATLLLLHRLLWPILERPMYLLQRHGVVGNKKLLWSLGLVLIALPSEISVSFWKLLLSKLL